jgi:phosphate uptake regulator
MKRKIIAQKNSFTITLPKKWTDINGFKAGNELDIEEVENKLIISSKSSIQKKEKEISLIQDIEYESIIRTQLQNYYRLGYDTLKVDFNTDKQADIIEEIVNSRLLGFEIITKKKNQIIIESITEPGEEKQEVIQRRLFFSIDESFNIIIEDFSKKKFPNLNKFKEKSKLSSKYVNFLYRNITKRNFNDSKKSIYWNTYDYLLIIQHELLHLYEVLIDNKNIPDILVSLFKTLRTEFNNVHNSFYKKDLKVLLHTSKNLAKLSSSKIQPLMKSNKNSITLYYFAYLTRMIYLMIHTMNALILE